MGKNEDIRKRCYWCGERQTAFYSQEAMMQWMEIHSPYWAPAHRKCTDACEAEATAVLAKRYREEPEGLENFVPGTVPPARVLDRTEGSTGTND